MVAQDLYRIDQALKSQPDQHLEFLAHKELLSEILELQIRKQALMLGHNYMSPLVYQLSSESNRGDSLSLSRIAAQTQHPIIVYLMAYVSWLKPPRF